MQTNMFQVGAVAESLDHLGPDVAGGYLEDTDGSVHSIGPFDCVVSGGAATTEEIAVIEFSDPQR